MNDQSVMPLPRSLKDKGISFEASIKKNLGRKWKKLPKEDWKIVREMSQSQRACSGLIKVLGENEKGEVMISTFIVVFIAALLAYGTIEAVKSCRLYCKLDLPKFEEIALARIGGR